MNYYSAKILFQWRPIKNGISRKRRVCEERIYLYTASSHEEAYEIAVNYGNEEEFEEIFEKSKVKFEFIGILGIQDVSISSSEGEVWSEIKEMILPAERKDKIIPKKEDLDIFSKNCREHKLKYRYK
jgi:hypothetical protein